MTTNTNAELIADNRKWVQLHRANRYQAEAAKRMTEVLDALEAAEQRAGQFEASRNNALREEALLRAANQELFARAVAAEQRAEEAVSQRNRAYRQRDEEREAKEGNIRALNRVTEERDRLDEAFDRDLPWRYDEVEAQRNQLAAVVEKVREWVEDPASRIDIHVWPTNLSRFLAMAPADALREHDAELIEKLADKAEKSFDHAYDFEVDHGQDAYASGYRAGRRSINRAIFMGASRSRQRREEQGRG